MKKVLLLDSGSGGINILKKCVEVCPHCDFLMFCDNKNLPYGNKSVEELQKITLKNLKNIYSFFKFDIVILACNTLTCTCIDFVREIFPDVVFIGTVPAIKPALEIFDAKDILVLATDVTIKHNKLIGKTPNLKLKSMPTLASDIDTHLDELDGLRGGLKVELAPFVVSNDYEKMKNNPHEKQHGCPKAVVLGCTHYVAVKNILQEIFGNDVKFFDSADGVARRLLSFVGDCENSFQVQIMVTENENLLAQFWNYYWN